MKKKGFTLVELLATIVVLSVIALIAVPIVINVIEKAKKSALVSSVNGLVESANMYYTNEIIKGDINDNVIFDFEEGIQTSDNKLSYKGKVYNGKLILTSDSDVITCIDDGKYYAYKEKNSDEVVSGIGTCLYDGTTGDFTIESDIDVIQKECDSDKKELQDKIDELTDNVNNLETLINEKEYEISNLQSTIDNLNNEITVLTGEKEDLQNQLASSNTSNSELQEKINELNGTIATLESSIEAKNNEITVLNGEKDDLQTALDNKTAELATLNENLGRVTASASDVLSGKIILTSSGLVTGSMTNNGSVSQTLNAGESYTIPKGYHDGTGKVTAYSLSSQTSGTAVASNILSGKTAYVNGSKIIGTMANKSGATVSATTVAESGENALITIPNSGYYDTNSKVSVPIETIKSNINGLSIRTSLLPIYSQSKVGSYGSTNTTVNITKNSTYILFVSFDDNGVSHTVTVDGINCDSITTYSNSNISITMLVNQSYADSGYNLGTYAKVYKITALQSSNISISIGTGVRGCGAYTMIETTDMGLDYNVDYNLRKGSYGTETLSVMLEKNKTYFFSMTFDDNGSSGITYNIDGTDAKNINYGALTSSGILIKKINYQSYADSGYNLGLYQIFYEITTSENCTININYGTGVRGAAVGGIVS